MYAPPPVDWRSYPRNTVYQQQPQLNYAEQQQQQSIQPINMYATMPFVYPTPPSTALSSAPPTALASPHSATLSQPVQPQHAFMAPQMPLSARGGRGGRQQQQFNFHMDGMSSPATTNRGEEKEFTPGGMSAPISGNVGHRRPQTTGGIRNSNQASTSGGMNAGDSMFRFSSLSTTATPLLPTDYSANTVEEELAARKHYKVIDADVKQISAMNFPTKDYGTPLDRERERLRKALVRFHTLQAKENQAKKAAADAAFVKGAASPRSPQTKRYNIADAFTDHAPAEIPPIRPSSSYAHTGRRRATGPRKSAPTSGNQTARATPNVSRPTTAAPVHVTPHAALRPATALSATIQLPLTGAWSKSPHDTPASMRNVPFWLPVTKREGQALMDEVLDSGPAVLHGASPTQGDLSIEIHKQVEREFRHTHIPAEELLRLEELNRLQDEHEATMRAKRDRDPYRYDPSQFDHAGAQHANHPSAYVPYLGKQLQHQERQLGAISSPKGPERFYYYAMDGSLQATTLPPAINGPSAGAVAANAAQQPQQPQQPAPALPLGVADPALPNLLGWVMSLHPERMALRQAAGRWRRQMARRTHSRSNSPSKFYHHHAQDAHDDEQQQQEPEEDSIQLQQQHSARSGDGRPARPSEESHFRRESHETHASGQQTPTTAASDSQEEFFGSSAVTRSPYYSSPMPVIPSPPDKSLDNLPGWKREILLAEQRQKDKLKSQREWARRQEAEDMAEEMKELEAKNRTGGMNAEEKRVYELLHKKPAVDDDGSNLMLYPLSNQKDPRSLLSLIPTDDRMVDNLAFPEPFRVSHLEPAELNRQPKPNWRALGDSQADEARRHQEMLEQEAFFQMPDMPQSVSDEAKDQDSLVLQKRKSTKKRKTDREKSPVSASRAVEPEQPAPSAAVEVSTQTDDFELTAAAAAPIAAPDVTPEPAKEDTPPVPAEIKRREHLYDWFRSDNCQFLSQNISSNLTPHTPWLHALVVETRAYDINDDQLAQLLSIMNKNLGNNPCVAAEDVLAAFMDAADVLGFPRKTPMPSIRTLPSLPTPAAPADESTSSKVAAAVPSQHLSDAEVQQLQPTKATADYVQPFSAAQHFEQPQEQIEGAQPVEPTNAQLKPAPQESEAPAAVELPPSVLEVPAASPSDLPFSSNPELAIQQSAVQGEKELPDSVENDEENAQKSLVFLHDIFRDSGSRLIGGELQGLIEEDGVAAPWLKVLLGEMLEKYQMKPAALMALLRDLIDSTPKHVVATNVSSDPTIETVIEKETASDVTAFTYSDLVARILKHKELREGEAREKQRIFDEERLAKEQEEQKKKEEAEAEAETARKMRDAAAEEEKKKQEAMKAEQAPVTQEAEATVAASTEINSQPPQQEASPQSDASEPQPSSTDADVSEPAAPAVKTYSLKKRDSQPSQTAVAPFGGSEIQPQPLQSQEPVSHESHSQPVSLPHPELQVTSLKTEQNESSTTSAHSEPHELHEARTEPHVPTSEGVSSDIPAASPVVEVSPTSVPVATEPIALVHNHASVPVQPTPEISSSPSVVQIEPVTVAATAGPQHAPVDAPATTSVPPGAVPSVSVVEPQPAAVVEAQSTSVEPVKATVPQIAHPDVATAGSVRPQSSSDHAPHTAAVVVAAEVSAVASETATVATPVVDASMSDNLLSTSNATPTQQQPPPESARIPSVHNLAEPVIVSSEVPNEAAVSHTAPAMSAPPNIPETNTTHASSSSSVPPASTAEVVPSTASISAPQSTPLQHVVDAHAPTAAAASVAEVFAPTISFNLTNNVKPSEISQVVALSTGNNQVTVVKVDNNPLPPATGVSDHVQHVNASAATILSPQVPATGEAVAAHTANAPPSK